jgi:uncharacterized surface protein with fasciclin (FAS1) repeats
MHGNRLLRRRVAVMLAALFAPLIVGTTAGAANASSAPSGNCDWVDAGAVADVSVVEATALLGELETFNTAVDAAGLTELLGGEGPFTVFAATNAAIDAVPEAVFASLINDPELLASIIEFHVVEGERLSAADLAAAGTVETLSGPLTFTSDGGTVVVNGQANIACPDIETANATVHVIDGLLQPATDDLAPGSSSSVPGSSVPGSSVPGSSIPAP